MANKTKPIFNDVAGAVSINNGIMVGGSVVADLPLTYSLGKSTSPWATGYITSIVGNTISITNGITSSLLGTSSVSINSVSSSYSINAQTASTIINNIIRISSSYVIPLRDQTIICLQTGSISLTLPTASIVGTVLNIKNGISGSWGITVTGSERIDNQSNIIINSPYSSMTVQSDGRQWWII